MRSGKPSERQQRRDCCAPVARARAACSVPNRLDRIRRKQRRLDRSAQPSLSPADRGVLALFQTSPFSSPSKVRPRCGAHTRPAASRCAWRLHPQKTVSSRPGSIAGPRAAKEQPQCACICTCCICVPPFVREQPPPSPAARHDGNHASTRWKKPQPGSAVTRISYKRHCCRASGAGAASNESPGRTSVRMSGIGRNKHPAAGSERGVAARGGVPVLPGASPGGQRT